MILLSWFYSYQSYGDEKDAKKLDSGDSKYVWQKFCSIRFFLFNPKLTVLKKLPEEINDSRNREKTTFKALSVYIYIHYQQQRRLHSFQCWAQHILLSTMMVPTKEMKWFSWKKKWNINFQFMIKLMILLSWFYSYQSYGDEKDAEKLDSGDS